MANAPHPDTSPAKPPPGTVPTGHAGEKLADKIDKELKEPRPKLLTKDEQKGLVGELKPGDMGWLEIDEKGKPVGSATLEPPKGKRAIPVEVPAIPEVPDLMTPSGAHLLDNRMNPSPQADKYSSPSYHVDYKAQAEKEQKQFDAIRAERAARAS